MNLGGEKYASFGVDRSKGTLAFQLAGNIKRGGLVEKGFGITLRELIEDWGGGTASGRPVKAVQVGGPLGAYIPAEQLDTPLDYEAFIEIGAMVGHGGIVVFDDTANMAQQARFAMEFCAIESCGKCTPCRIGSTRGVEVIDRMVDGVEREANYDLLVELCDTMEDASLCAMGGMTPFPVRSVLKYFAEDSRPLWGLTNEQGQTRRPRHAGVRQYGNGTGRNRRAARNRQGRDQYPACRARKSGVDVPKLCATDSLKPFGSCRMCLVEVEGRKGYPASCTTPIEAGMKIRTQTEALAQLRRNVMELYISDHPLDCLTCAANGDCELQDMAGAVGLREVRYGFEGENHLDAGVDSSNPYFQFDASKCIVCSRCVRACDEVQGTFRADDPGARIRVQGIGRHQRRLPRLRMCFLRCVCSGLPDGNPDGKEHRRHGQPSAAS